MMISSVTRVATLESTSGTPVCTTQYELYHPAVELEEEEGLHGVFKRLRRNGHQLEKGCCEQLSSRTSHRC
jgi:catechol-2,3-dioxygenase